MTLQVIIILTERADGKMASQTSFIIGDYSDSEDEGLQSRSDSTTGCYKKMVECADGTTQTESRAPTPPPEGEARSLEECVNIMKGDVSKSFLMKAMSVMFYFVYSPPYNIDSTYLHLHLLS